MSWDKFEYESILFEDIDIRHHILKKVEVSQTDITEDLVESFSQIDISEDPVESPRLDDQMRTKDFTRYERKDASKSLKLPEW